MICHGLEAEGPLSEIVRSWLFGRHRTHVEEAAWRREGLTHRTLPEAVCQAGWAGLVLQELPEGGAAPHS